MLRTNNFGNTTSVSGSANGKGRAIVPIFANKKKRLKQALYSDPSMDEFTVNEDGMDEIESLEKSLYPEESGCFETHSFGKDGLCYHPSFRKSNPSTSEVQTVKHSNALTSSSHPSHSSYGKTMKAAQTANRNGRGGKETGSLYGEVNQKSIPSGVVTSTEICTPPKQNFNSNRANERAPVKKPPHQQGRQLPLLPPPRGNQRTAKRNLASTFDAGAMGNGHRELGSNAFKQDENLSSSKASSKQVNMMNKEQSNSLLFITASIDSLRKWAQYRDQLHLIFEVFGILDSQVSMNANGNGKHFIVKDKTGTLRCTFWEMDRTLPKLSRGQVIRCVGNLDRKTQVFYCVSVRPAQSLEQKMVTASMTASESALQEILWDTKRD